jgi:hypothetical protein
MVRDSSEIMEIMMLELTAVDLDALCEALEDHSDFLRWFVDPATGEVLAWSDDMEEEPDPEERGCLFIDPMPSHEGYRDMADFVGRVSDRRAADLLARAIEGRGAFRRFKDTLFEFPELRQTWFEFHDVRMRRRAIEWLVEAELVDEEAAVAAIDALVEPPVGRGLPDPDELAAEVATGLREIFGGRLVDVVMFGSQATGTADEDSDLDLAVVLRHVRSSWQDAQLMDSLLWQKTRDSGVTVSAVVVDELDWNEPRRPLVRTAKAQGRSVA